MKSAVIEVVLRRRLGQRRFHQRRADAVDPHAAVAPFERQRLGHLQHAALRGEIGAGPGIGGEGADRGDVDDAALALREHLAAEGLAAEIRALQIEIEDEVEPLLGKFLGRAVRARRSRWRSRRADLPDRDADVAGHGLSMPGRDGFLTPAGHRRQDDERVALADVVSARRGRGRPRR